MIDKSVKSKVQEKSCTTLESAKCDASIINTIALVEAMSDLITTLSQISTCLSTTLHYWRVVRSWVFISEGFLSERKCIDLVEWMGLV